MFRLPDTLLHQTHRSNQMPGSNGKIHLIGVATAPSKTRNSTIRKYLDASHIAPHSPPHRFHPGFHRHCR